MSLLNVGAGDEGVLCARVSAGTAKMAATTTPLPNHVTRLVMSDLLVSILKD